MSTACESKDADNVGFVQNPEVQEQPLRDLISQRGWNLYKGYSDRASGAKDRRPGLDALMADARCGLFDVVTVWHFDHFARSVKQLVLGLESADLLESISFHIKKHWIPDTDGQSDVHNHRGHGGTRTQYQSRVGDSRHGRCTSKRPRPGNPIGKPRAVFCVDLIPHFLESGLSWRETARKLGVTARRAYRNDKSCSELVHTRSGPETIDLQSQTSYSALS